MVFSLKDGLYQHYPVSNVEGDHVPYPLKTINLLLDLLQIEQWLHPFPLSLTKRQGIPLDNFVTNQKIFPLSISKSITSDSFPYETCNFKIMFTNPFHSDFPSPYMHLIWVWISLWLYDVTTNFNLFLLFVY